LDFKIIFTDEYCENEKHYWEQKYKKTLSTHEVRQIIINLVEAFDTLYEWQVNSGSRVQMGLLKNN